MAANFAVIECPLRNQLAAKKAGQIAFLTFCMHLYCVAKWDVAQEMERN